MTPKKTKTPTITPIPTPNQRCKRDFKRLDDQGNAVIKPMFFADTDLEIDLIPKDQVGAVPGEINNCLITQGCQRSFGAVYAEVGRTYSYIEFPTYVIKYRTLDLARMTTIAFDTKTHNFLGKVRLGRITPGLRATRIQGKTSGKGGGNPRRVSLTASSLLRPVARH